MKRKPEIIKVKLSSTFVGKGFCKYCGGKPKHFYYVRNRILFHDQNSIRQLFPALMTFVKSFGQDWFTWIAPGIQTKQSHIAYTPNQLKYNPRTHSMYSSKTENKSSVSEYLSCDCERTTWAFTQKANDKRPELLNRKAKGTFKDKFVY